jgi:hypothetical protein
VPHIASTLAQGAWNVASTLGALVLKMTLGDGVIRRTHIAGGGGVPARQLETESWN